MVMLYPYPQSGWREERRSSRRLTRLVAIALLSPLVLFCGVGVDMMRGYVAQARLSQAADAAALAGGRVFFDVQRNSHIHRFFDATFPIGFLGSAPVELDVRVDEAQRTLTLRARTSMDLYFLDLVGQGDLVLEAVSRVHRSSRNADPQLERVP